MQISGQLIDNNGQNRSVTTGRFVEMKLAKCSLALKDHNALAYCEFPSLDIQGKVVAVTCLLDDKPHDFTIEDQSILRIIGQQHFARIA